MLKSVTNLFTDQKFDCHRSRHRLFTDWNWCICMGVLGQGAWLRLELTGSMIETGTDVYVWEFWDREHDCCWSKQSLQTDCCWCIYMGVMGQGAWLRLELMYMYGSSGTGSMIVAEVNRVYKQTVAELNTDRLKEWNWCVCMGFLGQGAWLMLK